MAILKATTIALSLCAGVAQAAQTTATLTVSGGSLVFSGEGLQPPDDEGHFAIGIKLPIAHVKAEKCETDYLVVGLGDMNKDTADLSANDRKVIAHNSSMYAGLVAAAKANKSITLAFKNNPQYLKLHKGILTESYCESSINDAKGQNND